MIDLLVPEMVPFAVTAFGMQGADCTNLAVGVADIVIWVAQKVVFDSRFKSRCG